MIREFRKNEMKTQNRCSGRGAHGGCFQDLEICENKFAQGEKNVTWTCWDLRSFFSRFSQSSSFVRSTSVYSATFHRDLLLLLLNPCNIFSAVTALQAAAQLEGACLLCPICVMSIYLSIDLSVHFAASPAAAGFVCYTAAILLAATS